MEDYSHHGFHGNHASATISKKNSSANAFAPKAVYEDVFGGPPKFGVPTFSSRIEDYTEIFGTFRSSSRRSSIPFLDLPVPDPADVSVGFKFDYSEIFDDLNGVDFFDSHEELFCDSKGRESSSSEEAWTPDGRGSPSDGSSVDTLACSENNRLMSDGVAAHKFDGAKGFDVSNHGCVQISGEDGTNGTTHTGQCQAAVDGSIPPQKTEVAGTSPLGFSDVNGNSNGGTMEEKCFKKTMSLPPMYNSITMSSGNDLRPSNHKSLQRSEEDGTNVTSHTGQDQTVPGVRFVADGNTLPQKTEVVNMLPREVSDISGNMDSSGGTVEEKNLKKTMSLPPNYSSLSKSSGKDFKLQNRAHGNGSNSGNIFLTVSELSLQTQPSQMPPPKRQPPKLSIKQRNSKIGSEKYGLEGSTGDYSSNFFDEDVDASSSAAASAAAIKEAMEKAQARINSAKESMERKKDGLQSRTKLGLKDDLSSRARKEDIKATHEAFRSRGVVPQETSEKEHVGMKGFGGKEGQHDSRTAQVATDFEGKEKRLNVGKKLFEPNILKDPISAEESHIHKEAVEWKVEKQFYELAKTGKLNIALEVPEQFEIGEKSISPPITQKDEESEDVATKPVSEVGEENVEISNALKGACEQENIRKLDATKEAHESKKGEKKLKVAQGSIWREENEKKLKFSQESSEQVEDEKKLQLPSALEGHGKKLEEDHGQKENEKKLEEACESEESEKRQREASCRKVDERRLKDTDEQEENGKKLTESCNIEENEKRLKDSSEQEEREKKLKEACDGRRLQEVLEKGENDKWQEEVLEGEESEKQLEEAHEKGGNGKKIQEALECEESEKRLKQDFEWEENERRLKEAPKQKESENIKENEKRLEVFELEESEKGLKEVHKQKECENRLKESCAIDAIETQLEVVFELVENQGERLGNEEEKYENREKWACKGEENENKANVDQEACDLEADKILMMAGMPCEPLSSNNCEASQEGLEHEENIGKLEVASEAIEHEGSGKITEAAKDVCESERSKKELIIASARNRDDESGRSKPANVPQCDPEQDKCEHIKVSMKGLSLDEPDNRLGEPETTNYMEQSEKTNRTLPVACDRESLGKSQVSFDRENFKEKNDAAEGIKNCVENEKEPGLGHSVISSEAKGNVWKVAQQAGKSQNREREERNDETCNNVEREKEVRLQREREVEEERLRKIEEEKERERERKKDRMAVERATREARERAFNEARERAGKDRAERAAVERATNEVRQRAMAEGREKVEKTSAEAREKSLTEKAMMEARLRAERAAVERATAEARERAAEKAALEARRQAERSVPDRFATTNSKDSGMKRSSSLYEFRETQVKGSGSNNSLRHTKSSVHASNTSVKFQGTEGESAQRCKARLERHQRTFERAAKALAEKNSHDLLAQREQAERNRLAETLDAEVRRWSSGKEGNLRALLSTLQYILGPDSGWQPIPLTEVITAVAVKKAYRKATLCVHPDKLQQRGASIQQKYICEKVFDLLKEAWNKFNSEER